jgi:glycosyltransferase involved in cell wall biosynthesis
MDVSIIVPVFNEEDYVVEAVRRALAVDLGVGKREVIVVDDGSTDRSMELLRAAEYPEDEVRIIELPRNRGKGFAVRAGAEHAKGTYLAILDADFEYDASDYAKMIPPIRDDGMDACIGTRLWAAHSAYGYWYVMGNRVINTVCNVLFNSWLSDFGAGPKVVPTDTFRSLDLRENGFGFDAELVARLLKAKKRIYEVPVFYRARNREEGKKITTRDGVRILGVFLRVRIR